MMLVPHYVDRSPIAGLGLYCATDLSAGTVIYRHDERFVVIIRNEELAAMPEAMQESVLRYSYRSRGARRLSNALYYCADDARFMNHADDPSTRWRPETDDYVTTRDLPAGSELSCDYRDFCEPEDCDFKL